MDLYSIRCVHWHDAEYASCFVAEPVQWANPGEVCEACYEPTHRGRVGAYTILWFPGSSVIPDLVDCFKDLIVTQRVKDAFDAAALSGYTAWPLKIKEPPKRAKSKWPIVPSPYPGPPLWDIYVDPDQIVRLVPEESSIVYHGVCEKCGAEQWGPNEDIDVEKRWYVVDRCTWKGQDFMLPFEINGLLVTERVADVIRRGDYTNFKLQHVGRISD